MHEQRPGERNLLVGDARRADRVAPGVGSPQRDNLVPATVPPQGLASLFKDGG